jgi:CTP:phosphocholine cytidylyltransferase-like protein/thiamine kinase-like enzyme
MYQVDNAIILAAGFGSRFVPLTFDLPKGLIPVKGIPMLERQIQQLKEKGINKIIIVVGYLKEKFDYLIDKYQVKLIFNPEFATRNNLSSLYYARKYLKNTYILAADNWIEENIFNAFEEKSWYSCIYINGPTSEWCVAYDAEGRIFDVTISGKDSWVMYGPVFFLEDFSYAFSKKIEKYYHKYGTENYMWENVLIDEIQCFNLYINKQSDKNVYEFESLEELRLFDPDYGNKTPNMALKTIEKVFFIDAKDISNIKNLKAGMTNKSFRFSLQNGETYIFRLPGEGTERLINRKQEKIVYDTIKHLKISDEVVFFDEKNGYKISKFYHEARNTSAGNMDEVRQSMEILLLIHRSGLCVDYEFNIEKEINRYIKLCADREAIRYIDYKETLDKMYTLIDFVKKIAVPVTMCHVDSNPDNFLHLSDNSIKLIDWEYAGMCDPLIDVAMYAIYAYYSKEQADELLHIYMQRDPIREEYIRFYAYMALGGYLWSIWTEYKQSCGVEFGEYGMKMYRYAKDYYNYVIKLKFSSD